MHDVEAAQQEQGVAAARRVADAAESRHRRIEKIRKEDEGTRKILGREDFVGVSFLEAGVGASRAVGRVVIREDGDIAGFGTGSLVSPALLLTNHHVLPSADVASGSSIEFRFQDGVDGSELEPQPFELDPQRFFLADEGLDFALVAVGAGDADLADFGFNRLTDDAGDDAVATFVTIVQHPGGKKKQVALRENRIVDVLDSFVHYAADTEPGSSGSPVFDDGWRVVALHHASVRAPDRTELGGFVNEGIRATNLRAFIGSQSFSADEQSLVDEVLG